MLFKNVGIGKPKSNDHYFCEQIKTILLQLYLYFEVADKCSVVSYKCSVATEMDSNFKI